MIFNKSESGEVAGNWDEEVPEKFGDCVFSTVFAECRRNT